MEHRRWQSDCDDGDGLLFMAPTPRSPARPGLQALVGTRRATNRAEERRAKLKAFNYRFKNNPHNLNETDNEPAYKRHGINIENDTNSSDAVQGKMTLNNENGADLKSNNSFLHDNVD